MMITSEIQRYPDLDRHLDQRIRTLHRHENIRLEGDRLREGGNLPQAREVYGRVVDVAGKRSAERYRAQTEEIIAGWLAAELILPDDAFLFLERCNLGYAGETRVAVVAATSEARIPKSEEERDELIYGTALRIHARHEFWRETLEGRHETIDRHPTVWEISLANDEAAAAEVVDEFEFATKRLSEAYQKAREIINDPEIADEVKRGAASDGGVARVRQARLMQGEYDEKIILQTFREGRELVHWADWQNENFERIRVIEMWYSQYLWQSRNIGALAGTIPTWIKLLVKHPGTRKMFLGLAQKKIGLGKRGE